MPNQYSEDYPVCPEAHRVATQYITAKQTTMNLAVGANELTGSGILGAYLYQRRCAKQVSQHAEKHPNDIEPDLRFELITPDEKAQALLHEPLDTDDLI